MSGMRRLQPRALARSLSSSVGSATVRFENGNGGLHKRHKYTVSDAFFEALWDGGVKACFANFGSDHPSILEAIAKGKKQWPHRFPKIYTCPTEMVAISMADGWARVNNKPQAVLAHVDVGTSSLGGGLHNASIGHSPILIFAGMNAVTESPIISGHRTEYHHWLQNPSDQAAIVRQYCRHVGDLKMPGTIKKSVARALQFASSGAKGPVYLTGAREVMATEVKGAAFVEEAKVKSNNYMPIGPSALPQSAIEMISNAFVTAERPIIITGYSGRNHATPAQLVKLADLIPGLRVFDTAGSDMCFPSSHPANMGFKLAFDTAISDSDMILVLDCHVPWIPARNPPRDDAVIFHVDVDPLKERTPISFYPAIGRWKADSLTAMTQINDHIERHEELQARLQDEKYQRRAEMLRAAHQRRLQHLDELARPLLNDAISIHYLASILRTRLPPRTTYVVEAVTNSMDLHDQLRLTEPGQWLNCGGTGLGWLGGAALGVKLALEEEGRNGDDGFVCSVVGDGSFLFSGPSSWSWVAGRYGIPGLVIVLENGGWKAPRNSLDLVHPDGTASQSNSNHIGISLEPSPDYSGIAKAATGKTFGSTGKPLFAAKITKASKVQIVLEEAVTAVREGRGAVVEVVLENRA